MVWIVAAAGGVGAVARYLLDGWVQARRDTAFPLGTFAVNISGSLALGVIVGLALDAGVDGDVRTIAGIGFLGGYTTFSTLTFETMILARDGALRTAALNVLGSVVVGLAAAAAGLATVFALSS